MLKLAIYINAVTYIFNIAICFIVKFKLIQFYNCNFKITINHLSTTTKPVQMDSCFDRIFNW